MKTSNTNRLTERMRDCPYLYRMMHAIHDGGDEEDLMVDTLLALSEGRMHAVNEAVQALARVPAPPLLPSQPQDGDPQ